MLDWFKLKIITDGLKLCQNMYAQISGANMNFIQVKIKLLSNAQYAIKKY